MGIFSFLSFLCKKKKLKKEQSFSIFSSDSSKKLKSLLSKKGIDNDAIFRELEEILITADVSVQNTMNLLDQFQQILLNNEDHDVDLYKNFQILLLQNLTLKPFQLEDNILNIILVFGINGVGKTTSVAKLCYYFVKQNKNVVIAAADTYRAAAANQLKQWTDSMNQHLVYHEGKSKPSAVIFDALDTSIAKKKDVLIIDTAGRIHNREDLLQELDKLKKIIQKKAPEAAVNHILVLDATTGNNALSQAEHFHDSIGIDGVLLSKMDSSGKGGIALNLSIQYQIPIFFLGHGENKEDMSIFDREKYIESLF